MKKTRVILMAGILAAGMAVGCGSSGGNQNVAEKTVNQNQSETSSDAIKVVCTIFPEYDWVQEVAGRENKNVDCTLLLKDGVDLHSYQPTTEDMASVADCDLFLYVGGESDGWVEDALKESTNPDMEVINLMDVLKDTVKEEEVVEGMQAEEEESSEEEEGPEYDEHVWLSLKNAQTLVKEIANRLEKIDPDQKDMYEKNESEYVKKLADLDQKFEKTASEAKNKTLVFGDRFPFRYFADDYKLPYYAAFVGCSAETEASFQTISFLAEKVDEVQAPAILTIENSDQKIAKAIQSNTKTKDQKILTMHSLQSVTQQDMDDGLTYLRVMEQNLDVFGQAVQ
ncbi:MAG: metal ABC transporter substrate-binding protein [Lachnospiraceae bacterium]